MIDWDSPDLLCCMLQEAVTAQTFLAASCLSTCCEFLQTHYSIVFVVQSELFSHGGGVLVVQSEAVLSWRRCFCGTQ